MLSALGVMLLDKKGAPIKRGAAGLRTLADIRIHKMPRVLSECRFSVACDVTNPLLGEQGCSAVFGPQKGATPMIVADMEKSLKKYAALTKEILPDASPDFPGAGAAGGLGFAFMTYLGAKLCPGIDLVIEATGLEEKIKAADVIVTGEGRLDGQSMMGKAPIGVARLAKKYKKTVIALVGSLASDAGLCHGEGIDAFFPILRAPCSLAKAMNPETAKKNTALAAEEAFRLIRAAKRR